MGIGRCEEHARRNNLFRRSGITALFVVMVIALQSSPSDTFTPSAKAQTSVPNPNVTTTLFNGRSFRTTTTATTTPVTVLVPPSVIVLTPPTTTTTTIAPVLQLSVTNADFGPTSVGVSSAPNSLVVTNEGNLVIVLVSVVTEGPYAASGGSCVPGVALLPGQNCQVLVSFAPKNPGPQNGRLVVVANSPIGDVSAVGNLAGSGTRNSIAIEAPVVDFGAVLLGDAVPAANLVIRNTGSSSVKIAKVVLGPKAKEFAVAAKTCIGKLLPPQATCPFKVSVKPTAGGARSVLVIATGASGEAAQATLRIRISVAKLAITPIPMLLGTVIVGTPAAAKAMVVKNLGDVAVKVSKITLTGPQASEFVIVSDGCTGKTIAPKKTCPLTVAGTPAAAGLRAVEITVASSLKLPTKGSLRLIGKAVVTTTLVPLTTPTTPTPPASTIQRFDPKLVMNPAVGTPGRPTEAQGSGFPANSVVQLAWQGQPVLRDVTTDASGSFRVSVVLLRGERPGTRFMTVVDQEPNFGGVRAPFLLQLPTFQPPGGAGNPNSMVGRG